MSEPTLSVVICTHNPRPVYLARTLAGLKAQENSPAHWELILIDNASKTPVSSMGLDLAGHPETRIVVEPETGLTAARMRGIAETRGEILLFVDDDNILASDYLAKATQIARDFPTLGAWGCGCYKPEWEVIPPTAFTPYLSYLAVHAATKDHWSNRPFDYAATPAGAGLCVRRNVAERYATNVRTDPRRKQLDRIGGGLAGCGDFDLALTATDLGLGVGIFTGLSLTHLMPRSRIEENYLLRLVEGHASSTVLLHALRDPTFTVARRGPIAAIREWRLRRSLDPIALKIHDARRRGERSAWAQLQREAIRANHG